MPTQKHGKPFFAELKPSKTLRKLIIAVHLLALGASIANAFPIIVKCGALMLVALNFTMAYRPLLTESRKIKCSAKGNWEIAWENDFESVDILKSTVISPFCVFLHLKQKPAILIVHDALEKSDYRELVVKLKMTMN